MRVVYDPTLSNRSPNIYTNCGEHKQGSRKEGNPARPHREIRKEINDRKHVGGRSRPGHHPRAWGTRRLQILSPIIHTITHCQRSLFHPSVAFRIRSQKARAKHKRTNQPESLLRVSQPHVRQSRRRQQHTRRRTAQMGACGDEHDGPNSDQHANTCNGKCQSRHRATTLQGRREPEAVLKQHQGVSGGVRGIGNVQEGGEAMGSGFGHGGIV